MLTNGDIVVLIPGISGSVLERKGKEIWGVSTGAVLRGLFSGGHSIQELILSSEMQASDSDESNESSDLDDSGDGVVATRLVRDVHILPRVSLIDGYTKVANRLQQRLKLTLDKDYFEFPYDWRRDNRHSARLLRRDVAKWLTRQRTAYPHAKVVFVAHSMGGLIARYYIEVLGGWADTRSLITFGTPYRGSIDALDSLVNGVEKLRGAVDFTELTRSFTSVYQLLPIYPCYDDGTGSLSRLRDLAALPRLSETHQKKVVNADQFHREIEAAVTQNAERAAGTERYTIRSIVGIEQPTFQSARVTQSGIELLRSRSGVDEMGDGTVPRVSATPIELGEATATFATTRHASLQNADAVLAHVHGLLSAPRDLGQVRDNGAPTTLSLDIENLLVAGQPLDVAVRSSSHESLNILIENLDANEKPSVIALPVSDDEWRSVSIGPPPPGVYRITVSGNATRVEPVSDLVAIV
jgi:pimeloyl-ACP methyl ester carboxylesterase